MTKYIAVNDTYDYYDNMMKSTKRIVKGEFGDTTYSNSYMSRDQFVGFDC